jgi:choline dehydrogenase-like flavoprotein
MFSTLSKAHGSFSFAPDAARADMLRDHAPFVGRSILDWYVPAKAPVKKGGALNFLFPSGGPIFQSESVAVRGEDLVWGKALKERLREYWHEQKQVDCETFGEYLPTPGTSVSLDPEARDALGLAAARINIARHPHDLEVSRFLGARAAEVLDAAGAEKVWQSALGGRTMHLPMGGARMGDDPRSSVVNRDGRSHEVKNLYVSDGSVLPSSGGVPPTFTILANALRIGEGLVDAMRRKDL